MVTFSIPDYRPWLVNMAHYFLKFACMQRMRNPAYWHRLLLLLLVCGASCGISSSTSAQSPIQEDDPVVPLIRKFIQQSHMGTPNYADMEQEIAAKIAEKSAMLQSILNRFGSLDTIEFLRIQQNERIYALWFIHGKILLGIKIAPSGKISLLRILAT